MLFKIPLQNYDFSFVISVTFSYNFVTFSSLEKKYKKNEYFVTHFNLVFQIRHVSLLVRNRNTTFAPDITISEHITQLKEYER